MSFLNDALACAARGWSIIPIRHKPNTSGKQPAVKGWKQYQTRRPTEDELRAWFGNRCQPDGLAVILGEVSGGLICRDFDRLDAYQRWAAAHPDLAAKLPTVETARGRHVYFRAERQAFKDLGDGELRGNSGHYCLLPPSVHPSGVRYRWVIPLPEGELPTIDLRAAGLDSETECTEDTEDTERTESTEESERQNSNHQGSALSVSPIPADSLNGQIERAITGTLPKSEGQRNRAVFNLARALKGIPSLADAEPGALRSIVAQWHKRALPVIGTKPFDETYADFIAAWQNVRFPWGSDPLALVLQRVRAAPLPQITARYEDPKTRTLIAICRELQRSAGEGVFFLSCRKAGALVGLEPVTAARRLNMLVADKVLTVAQDGDARRARRYRYVGGE